MILFTLTHVLLLGINWNSIYYFLGSPSTPLTLGDTPFTPFWRKGEAIHALGFLEEPITPLGRLFTPPNAPMTPLMLQ